MQPLSDSARSVVRRAGFAAAALVVSLAVFVGAKFWMTRPSVAGLVRVAGAQAEVELLRDAYGVVHVFAQSELDAQFGLGYAHAQDRAFQIELFRRTAAGTLAELLGERAVSRDRLFRSLGLRELARTSFRALDAESRAAVGAYARGYNAALSSGASAPEFVALRAVPAHIDALDCIAIFKLVAYQLSGNMLRELENHRLARKFTYDEIARLAPPVPGDDAPPWPSEAAQRGVTGDWLDEVASLLLEGEPASDASATGSNAWAVTGARSRTGKPLLANDPHLELTAPAAWYLAQLHAPSLDVIGATLPGVPGVWLGRNDHVAWGVTNTGSDTQDLYIEQLDPGDARRVRTPEGSAPLTERVETIRVRGGETQRFVVRGSRHGPIVSDANPAKHEAGHLLALAWTGLAAVDRSVQFPFKAAKAQRAADLLAAARDVHAPQQNLIYADDSGVVGLKAIGALPLRASDEHVRGRLPVPGWDARYDWRGEVPFDALPEHTPDARGSVVNANDKITPPGYPYWFTSEWELPYRAERIARLLEARPQHGTADFARMQTDVESPVARALLPELLRQLGPGESSEQSLIEKLRRWDGKMRAGQSEPLVFEEWRRRLAEQLYPREFFSLRRVADPRVLLSLLQDVDAAPRVQRTFREALAALRERHGADWRWGQGNHAVFSHPVFSEVFGLGRLLNISLARGGSSETVDLSALWYDAERGDYVTIIGASLRAVYDLAEPERSLFVVSPGQSGNPLSPRYRDLAARWQRGEYIPMVTSRATLLRGAHDSLRLVPTGGHES